MIATLDEAGCIRIAEQIGAEQKALDGLKKEREAAICFILNELQRPADEIIPASVLAYAQQLHTIGKQIETQKTVIQKMQGIVNEFGVIYA